MDAAGAARLTPTERLRVAGLRATRPRRAVYEVLAELGGHRTVDDVYAALAERGHHVARTSVYNVLDDLQRSGLVMVADTGAGPARYEAAGTWHHHFVCRRCGRIDDVACAVGRKPCLEADLPGAVVDEAQVIYRGLCASCAAVTT